MHVLCLPQSSLQICEQILFTRPESFFLLLPICISFYKLEQEREEFWIRFLACSMKLVVLGEVKKSSDCGQIIKVKFVFDALLESQGFPGSVYIQESRRHRHLLPGIGSQNWPHRIPGFNKEHHPLNQVLISVDWASAGKRERRQ